MKEGVGGDAFFQYYFFVLFFPDYIYILFSGAETAKESGALPCQPDILRMGGAQVCIFDAHIHRYRISGGAFDGQATEETGNAYIGGAVPCLFNLF